MTEVLRPYQAQVIAEFWRAVEAGQRRILLVAPTASGKTVIARAIVEQARSKGCGSLFLAHRREILTQTSNKLRGIPHGIIRPGDQPRPLESVQVASVQTLHRRAIKAGTMELPEADLVIVDECHHVIARSYQSIIEQYPDSILLGLTATPCRGDGRGLGNVFQIMIQCPQVGELVEQGYLVPTRVYAAVDPDLHGVHIRHGDYVESELADRMDRPKLVGDIVTNWIKYGERRKTVCFATSVRHSIHIRDEFIASGVRAEHIDGTTPMDERDATLARLASGEIEVVSNCLVLTEGWDMPTLGCLILARPTRQMGLYRQMIGRGLRPAPDKIQLHRHRSLRRHLPARICRGSHRVDARPRSPRRESDPCRARWRPARRAKDRRMPGVRRRPRRRDGLPQLRLSAGATAARRRDHRWRSRPGRWQPQGATQSRRSRASAANGTACSPASRPSAATSPDGSPTSTKTSSATGRPTARGRCRRAIDRGPALGAIADDRLCPREGIRMKKKRTTAERYVRLTHRMMQTKAWQSLDSNARAIYVELATIYCGNNNGRIGLSARQAAQAIQVSTATAARAMIDLQDRGFIVATTKGRFDLKRHATDGGSPSSGATSPASQPLGTSRPGPPRHPPPPSPRRERREGHRWIAIDCLTTGTCLVSPQVL